MRCCNWTNTPCKPAIDRFNREATAKGWNITLPSEDLNLRLSGKLPELMIGDDPFFMDWRLRELRYARFPLSIIEFAGVEYTDDDRGYEFFYHQDDKTIYEIPEDITELPDRVVLVRIPDEYTLDPVAVAREEDLGEMAYEKVHPYRARHHSEVIPLSETYLPQMVADNRLFEQEIEGSPVMVDPGLPLNLGYRGRIGAIEVFNEELDLVFATFPNGDRASFRLGDLRVVKPLEQLREVLMPSDHASLPLYLRLVDVFKYRMAGTRDDLGKALEVMEGDARLLDMATVSLKEELQRRRDAGAPGEQPTPGRGR